MHTSLWFRRCMCRRCSIPRPSRCLPIFSRSSAKLRLRCSPNMVQRRADQPRGLSGLEHLLWHVCAASRLPNRFSGYRDRTAVASRPSSSARITADRHWLNGAPGGRVFGCTTLRAALHMISRGDAGPAPGGLIHRTDHWLVEHCVVHSGFDQLFVKPDRHVVHVADLDEAEAAELGPLVRPAARAVLRLCDSEQVYVCLWSHGPAHIHFVIQPVDRALIHGSERTARNSSSRCLSRSPHRTRQRSRRSQSRHDSSSVRHNWRSARRHNRSRERALCAAFNGRDDGARSVLVGHARRQAPRSLTETRVVGHASRGRTDVLHSSGR